jgi:hypothetical protein
MRNKMEVITAKFRGGGIGSDVQRYFPKYDFIADEADLDELPPPGPRDFLDPDASPFG